MKQPKQYTKEFNQSALPLLTDQQGRSISDAATSLSIPACSLSRSVRAAKPEGQQAFRGNSNRSTREQQIACLRRPVKQLEEEKEVL